MWRHKVTKKGIKTKRGERIEARFWEVGNKQNRKRFNKRFASNKEYLSFAASLKDSGDGSLTDTWPTLAAIYNDYVSLCGNSRGWLTHLANYWKELEPLVGSVTADKVNNAFLTKLNTDLKNLPPRKVKRLKQNGETYYREVPRPGQATINKKVGFVRTLINWAHKQQKIPMNPISTEYKQPKAPKAKSQYRSEQEAQRFLDFANEKYPPGHPRRWVFVVYLVAINTALRSGEMWAMRPTWLDTEEMLIEVRQQWSTMEMQFKDTTKGKETRYVHLAPELLEELCNLRPLGSNELYFPNEEGGPMNHNNFINRYYKPDLREAGIKYIKWHAHGRHTAGTNMARKGVPLNVIQKILGHQDIRTTMAYVHSDKDDIKKVSEVFKLTTSLKPGAQVITARRKRKR